MRFEPVKPEHVPAVDRFNKRLSDGGWRQSFSPDLTSFFPEAGHSLYGEKFVLMDKDDEMRAGYCLKHQQFKNGDALYDIGNIQLPISEGIVNNKYASMGPAIVLDALKRTGLAYSLGMGGMHMPYPKLLRAFNWDMHSVPFFFKVIHPYRFCRRIKLLRSRKIARWLLDFLAFTGLGALGVYTHNLVSRIRQPNSRGISCEVVTGFGPWADIIWEQARSSYGMTAVRDSTTLDMLYPDEKFHRLKVLDNETTVGWSVCLSTTFADHKQFGALRLGSIVDCFASPDRSFQVARASLDFLKQQKVDLVVSNQCHKIWQNALKQLGFLQGPSNFVLAQSPKLTKVNNDNGITHGDIHMNRGDGDGPINL